MKLRLAVAIAALAISTSASAVTAIEFLKLEKENKEADLMKDLVIKFVSRGYKQVPNWAALSSATQKKILEKGYTYQNVEQVAEEAAIDAGMKR